MEIQSIKKTQTKGNLETESFGNPTGPAQASLAYTGEAVEEKNLRHWRHHRSMDTSVKGNVKYTKKLLRRKKYQRNLGQ